VALRDESDVTHAEVPFAVPVQPTRRSWRWGVAGGIALLALLALSPFLLRKNNEPIAAITKPTPTTPAIVPPTASAALSPRALVSEPAPLPGVRGWTITSRTGRGLVRAVAYHPQGRWVAAAGDDGVVRLLRPEHGRLERALVSHGGSVSSLAWTGDGQLLASGGDDMVALWDPETGKLVRSLPVAARCLAWAPRGRTLAVGRTNHTIELWQADAGKQPRVLSGHAATINALAWSADGKTLTSGSDDWSVRNWPDDSTQAAKYLYQHKGPVHTVAWSPDGQTLASGGADGLVRFWRPEPGPVREPLEAYKLKQPVRALAWSPDGKEIATGGMEVEAGKHVVKTWNVATGKPRLQWEGNEQVLTSLVWAPNVNVVVCSDYYVRFWNSESGKSLHSIDRHGNQTRAVAWSPDGKHLASYGAWGPACSRWDLASGQHLGYCGRLNSSVFTWSPDGKIVVGESNNDLLIVDVASGKYLQTLKGHTARPSCLAFSPDGKVLASGSSDKTVRVWQVETGEALHVFADAASPVRAVAWHPEGKSLAALCDEPKVYLLSIETGRLLLTMTGIVNRPEALAWSPNGKMLAASEDGHICLWEDPGQLRKRFAWGGKGVVRPLTWLPNGDTLAGVCPDGKLRFWDGRGQLQRTVPTTALIGAAFSRDGTLLASGSGAFALRIWDTDTGRPHGTAVLWRQGTLVLSADGHYSGPPALEEELVYVIETERGQETLSPNEFRQRFGWKNDPGRAQLFRLAGR
jgi:WD40 repeat protein